MFYLHRNADEMGDHPLAFSRELRHVIDFLQEIKTVLFHVEISTSTDPFLQKIEAKAKTT